MFTPKIGEDDPILTSICFRWLGSTTNQKRSAREEVQSEFVGDHLPGNLADLDLRRYLQPILGRLEIGGKPGSKRYPLKKSDSML